MKFFAELAGYMGFRKDGENKMKNAKTDLNYHQIHALIRGLKQKPMYCDHCHKKKTLELSSINHTYAENPYEWEWLCRECHIKADKEKPSLHPLDLQQVGINTKDIITVKNNSKDCLLRIQAKMVFEEIKEILEVEVKHEIKI